MKWVPVNWELISVLNLIQVTLMVVFVGLFLALLFPSIAASSEI
jgi:hypothetical protein